MPRRPAVAIPKPPRCLLKKTLEAWERYWGSSLAQTIEPTTDVIALERLFCLHDERERAYRGYKKERLVLGSQDQRVLNPLGKMMTVLDTEIRQLEDRFGLTPRSRLQLGITLGDAAKSMAELNRSLNIDDYEEDDPR
jgi:P27 family predicted phage terminase small subunit